MLQAKPTHERRDHPEKSHDGCLKCNCRGIRQRWRGKEVVGLEVRAKAKANSRPLKQPNFLDQTTQWDGAMIEPRLLATLELKRVWRGKMKDKDRKKKKKERKKEIKSQSDRQLNKNKKKKSRPSVWPAGRNVAEAVKPSLQQLTKYLFLVHINRIPRRMASRIHGSHRFAGFTFFSFGLFVSISAFRICWEA